METRPDFGAYLNALPIMGVDGSLFDTVGPDSPVRGKVMAKTGTTGVGDLLNLRPVLRTSGLGGYMTTSRGRELAFVFYVNNVLTASLEEIIAVAKDLGALSEIIYLEN